MNNKLCFAAAMLLISTAPLSTVAAPILDQEFIATNEDIGPTPWNPGTPVDWAQTFTAGLNGVFDRVELKVSRYSTTTLPLFVDIRTLTSGGAPTEPNTGSNVLGSVAVDPSAISTSLVFATIDFSSFSIPVSVGGMLAIVIRSDVFANPEYELRGQSAGGYSGGSAYLRWNGTGNVWGKHGSLPNADIVFRTYVEPVQNSVPEPAALALLGLGLAGLGMGRRKKV